MEKATLDIGYYIIRKVYAEKHFKDHLCDHWRGKKKCFSSFYLNLGTESQIMLLHYFGIKSEEDAKYLKMTEQDERSALFLDAPPVARTLHNLLLFFHNHGMNEGKIREGIYLKTVPKVQKKRYGNSANWGDFILSLPIDEQQELIDSITINYQYK